MLNNTHTSGLQLNFYTTGLSLIFEVVHGLSQYVMTLFDSLLCDPHNSSFFWKFIFTYHVFAPHITLSTFQVSYEVAMNSIRLSLGINNSMEDVDYIIEDLIRVTNELAQL